MQNPRIPAMGRRSRAPWRTPAHIRQVCAEWDADAGGRNSAEFRGKALGALTSPNPLTVVHLGAIFSLFFHQRGKGTQSAHLHALFRPSTTRAPIRRRRARCAVGRSRLAAPRRRAARQNFDRSLRVAAFFGATERQLCAPCAAISATNYQLPTTN